MSAHLDLDAMARRVIATNHYMTLGTRNNDGSPRLSPLYYTCAKYSDFYWASSPESRHSRNIDRRPHVEIVIFNSMAMVGEGEAVYIKATTAPVEGDRPGGVWAKAFRTTAGARQLTTEALNKSGLRWYVAHACSFKVHVAASEPVHGRGADTRQPADPAALG